MDRNDPSNDGQRAIALLKEQLERDSSDLSRSIAELCTAHPDLEAVLKTLGSAYRAGQAATAARSLHELVRTRWGDPDTITFVLDEEDESNTGSAVETTDVGAGLGRYSVLDEVARGGMGVIYRVRDTELNRTLAMKVMAGMPPESSDVSAVNVLSRFLEEAQLTAQRGTGADLSPDGRLIATGSRNQTTRFWEAATGLQDGAIVECASWVEDISFSANGRFVVSGCADSSGRRTRRPSIGPTADQR